MPVNIHGKEYITVAERLLAANGEIKSVTTKVLYLDPVVIKATVVTSKGTFTGISAANPNKDIEKQSPFEVAETSAVGRALAFAGYGTVGGVASAEEVVKAESTINYDYKPRVDASGKCPECGAVGKFHRPDCPNR